MKRMSNHRHRMRKYKRRRDRAFGKDPQKHMLMSIMYWHYWQNVYGPHQCLWDVD